MSGGSIVRCDQCARLVIWGQKCVCKHETRTPHTHSERVDGCFRCDLSRDEIEDAR